MALRATSLIGRVFNQRSVSKTFISKQPVFHNVRSRSLFSMPALDYDPKKGLKPLFSARSLAVHYQGVVGGQVVKLNKLVSGTPLEQASLEEIIRATNTDSGTAAIYNNASELWNHTFFFKGLTPFENQPDTDMMELIDIHFGGMDQFKEQFVRFAKSVWGGGWVWLVNQDGNLEIVASYSAFNPLLRRGTAPILALDMWEHSYWTDYDHRVSEYVENFFKVVNWAEVKKNWLTSEHVRKQTQVESEEYVDEEEEYEEEAEEQVASKSQRQ